jgi:hypothetical protein
MFFAALALVAGATSSQANLVTNGGFDSGLSGWVYDPGTWTDGGGYANLSFCTGCSLSQTLTTEVGKTYSLSFLYNPGVDAGGVSLWVDWGNYVFQLAVSGDPEWSYISYPLIYTYTATTTSTVLIFSGYSLSSIFGLDDVVVNAVATPLPAALPLFASGGAGLLGFVSWRRKRKARVSTKPLLIAA